MAGLIPLSVVAEFLGKRPAEMKSLIDLDGLPVIGVPTELKLVDKVLLLALHRWLAGRSKGFALTVDELEAEIERARESLRRKKMKREVAGV